MKPTPLSEGSMDQITSLGATEIAHKIARGDLSSSEVVEAHILRIESVNERLNAVIAPLFDRARADAARADEALKRGESAGPLHGVPITLKDSFDVAGTATNMGLSDRLSHRADRDGPLAARLRQAGAIILGKTNVAQMLMFNETDNPVYGRTNNPWNPDRSPGGSSGGEASIIAAKGSPLGLGSDIGGSIRLPAHVCGIHAFKPTSGRLTTQGHAALYAGMDAVRLQPGPLARSVPDLNLALGILAAPGQELFDPSLAPAPWRDSSDVDLGSLRIAFYTDNGFIEAAPALRRAVMEAAAALRDRGAKLEQWTPPDVPEAYDIYLKLMLADGLAGARRILGNSKRDWRIDRLVKSASLPAGARAVLSWMMRAAGQKRLSDNLDRVGPISADEYWKLNDRATSYRLRFQKALDGGEFDAIVCPPDALPALPHGGSYLLGDALSYASLYNLLGTPAGVVAATRVREGEQSDRAASKDKVESSAREAEQGSAGLPVGVQVVARHWREDVALAIMSALEQYFRTQPDYPSLESPR